MDMILCIQPKTTSISFNFSNRHQTQMDRCIVFFIIYVYLFNLLDGYTYLMNALKHVICQPKPTCPMLHVYLSG